MGRSNRSQEHRGPEERESRRDYREERETEHRKDRAERSFRQSRDLDSSRNSRRIEGEFRRSGSDSREQRAGGRGRRGSELGYQERQESRYADQGEQRRHRSESAGGRFGRREDRRGGGPGGNRGGNRRFEGDRGRTGGRGSSEGQSNYEPNGPRERRYEGRDGRGQPRREERFGAGERRGAGSGLKRRFGESPLGATRRADPASSGSGGSRSGGSGLATDRKASSGRRFNKPKAQSKLLKPSRKEGEPVRLQKFLAECGVASRRASEELITEGRVRVNGEVITELGTKINPMKDRVQVGKRTVVAAEKGILLFHKPRFVVSTLSDPEGRPSISDYLTKHYLSYFPVGRLDWESSGLIVLTNDGELAERLMHPRYEMDRFYEVRVEGRVPDRTLEKILKGVKLEDGWAKAESLRIVSIDDVSTWLEISIREGRNRLIRRMMSEAGHPVIKLRRTSHGPLKLGKLKSGELRKLTTEEYQNVRRKVFNMSA